METITISSVDYDAYRTVAQADSYLAAAIHAGTDWSGASTATKQQALITATRILDRQTWLAAYDTQAERLAVQDILDACCEMALALVQGSDFQTEQNISQKLQSIRAGSVALTYFRGAEGEALRFPVIVHELLHGYLAGDSPTVTGVATGTSGDSVTDDDYGFSSGL